MIHEVVAGQVIDGTAESKVHYIFQPFESEGVIVGIFLSYIVLNSLGASKDGSEPILLKDTYQLNKIFPSTQMRKADDPLLITVIFTNKCMEFLLLKVSCNSNNDRGNSKTLVYICSGNLSTENTMGFSSMMSND